MIKVIKHGHAQYELTCKFCECVFTFEDEDIENSGCQWDWAEWVVCPECNRQNEIYSRSKIEHHPYN